MINITKPIVFFDLETTGVDILTDKIVEIGCVTLFPDGNRKTYHSLINPGMPIPASATAVHGIKDEDVKDSPKFIDVAKDIAAFIELHDLGGYNILKFDIPILINEFARIGIVFSYQGRNIFDAYTVFKKLEPHTLAKALKFYTGQDIQDAHTAVGDVETTIDVFLGQLQTYTFQDAKHYSDYVLDGIFDLNGTCKLINGEPVLQVGKYKGVSLVNAYKQDPKYLNWMLGSDFPYETKQKIRQYLNI